MCPGCLRDRWRLARSEVFLHPCTLGLEREFWGAPLGGVGAVGGAGWWDPQPEVGVYRSHSCWWRSYISRLFFSALCLLVL